MDLDMECLERYAAFLFAYNRKMNLVSRNMNRSQFDVLLRESLLVANILTADSIVDVGSGNGVLGISIALTKPHKNVVLVETMQKKALFLREAIVHLKLINATVYNGPIQEYLRDEFASILGLAARGFPRNDLLCQYVNRGKICELVLITAESKIKKIRGNMENVSQRLYNIPWRSDIKIVKLEHVSRETKKNG
jgi:16S rRNA G527 N7-methylase RsmG